MKQDVKDLWVEALRSGDYKQTNGYLQDGDGYCCLGVLTDLYCKLKNIEWDDSLGYEDEDGRLRFWGDETLSPNCQVWAGLEEDNPSVTYKGKTEPLSFFNDGICGVDGLNFNEIADLIEQQL